jgi:hypothetical protein
MFATQHVVFSNLNSIVPIGPLVHVSALNNQKCHAVVLKGRNKKLWGKIMMHLSGYIYSEGSSDYELIIVPFNGQFYA